MQIIKLYDVVWLQFSSAVTSHLYNTNLICHSFIKHELNLKLFFIVSLGNFTDTSLSEVARVTQRRQWTRWNTVIYYFQRSTSFPFEATSASCCIHWSPPCLPFHFWHWSHHKTNSIHSAHITSFTIGCTCSDCIAVSFQPSDILEIAKCIYITATLCIPRQSL